MTTRDDHDDDRDRDRDDDDDDDLVVIDYKDLAAEPIYDDEDDENNNDGKVDLSPRLAAAFGGGGSDGGGGRLGVVAVRGVPGLVEARRALFASAHELATLPEEYLETRLTDPDSSYNAGWSRGKERIGAKPDAAKGSFYYNPVTDLPGTAADRAAWPASYPRNVWPDETTNDDGVVVLSGFRERAERLGRILRDVVVLAARHVDAYAVRTLKLPGHERDLLYDLLRTTDKVKARLLYYYPLDDEGKNDDPSSSSSSSSSRTEDSWIGWHNDSGFLTALAGDLYLDHRTGRPLNECPDPDAGLRVMARDGRVVRVRIPDDCAAVQMGECVQIVTGGGLAATPHCVRGVDPRRGEHVARVSEACFVDAGPAFPLTAPRPREEVTAAGVPTNRVPPLNDRWTRNEMPFGEFLRRTFDKYYDHAINGATTNTTTTESD